MLVGDKVLYLVTPSEWINYEAEFGRILGEREEGEEGLLLSDYVRFMEEFSPMELIEEYFTACDTDEDGGVSLLE